MTKAISASRRTSGHGFSLLEMVTVIAIILILAGMAIISINGTLPQQQATAGVNAAIAVFKQGRDTAIAERRNYQLMSGTPLLANQIGLERIEPGGGFTVLPAVTLPSPAQFNLDASITTTLPDSNFPLCTSGLCFGGTPTQQWLSDGTFVNAAGQPLNASIFVNVPGKPESQRAFTILGTTGRVRAYKWNGSAWVLQ